MKQWLLVFAAGVVAGVAIGLLAAGGRKETPGPHGAGGGPDRNRLTGSSRNVAGSKSGGREASRTGKAGERREGWHAGQPRLELMEYLSQMQEIDSMEEINFLELVRQGHEITMLSEDEATAMLHMMEELSREGVEDGELESVAFGLVFARFAELNGPAAMRYVMTLEEDVFSADRDDLMTVGMSSWADVDPEGAADWFREHAEGPDEEMARELRDEDVQGALLAALGRADPELARNLVLEGTGVIQDDVVELVARRETSVEGLKQLLDSTRPDDWQARRGILAEWSKRDAGAAADWLDRQPRSQHHGKIVLDVGRKLMEQDPESGRDWLMRQELPPEYRENRLVTVTGGLAQQDVVSAGEWLEQQENGPARDASERMLASRHAGQQNWEEAFRWAADVENPRNRQRALHQVLNASWDPTKKTYRGNSFEAARAAGFAAEAEALRRKALGE